jgi:prepilin peptidase dependent protein B
MTRTVSEPQVNPAVRTAARPSHRQAGFSLLEVMISMGLSLFVTAAMVALMSNSLGNTTRLIHMTKLSDDLRMTMQLMTRDVRRTSYNADAILCYGNDDCASDGSLTQPADIFISNAGDCFTFLLDRDHNGNGIDNAPGGFRRRVDDDIGVIEMWTGNGAPDCAAENNNEWVSLTDTSSMNITAFSVDDDLSYTQVIFDDGARQVSQKVRKLRLAIGGELRNSNGVNRQIEDIISVRNDLLL